MCIVQCPFSGFDEHTPSMFAGRGGSVDRRPRALFSFRPYSEQDSLPLTEAAIYVVGSHIITITINKLMRRQSSHTDTDRSYHAHKWDPLFLIASNNTIFQILYFSSGSHRWPCIRGYDISSRSVVTRSHGTGDTCYTVE